MHNTDTVFVLMRCERGWPEDQYPRVVAVSHTKSALYEYLQRNCPCAEKELIDDEYEEWHGDYFDYWIEEHKLLD